MKKYLLEKMVRLRCRKAYPEAHTHVLIGRVLDETDHYLVIRGRTFHFGSLASRKRESVQAGETMVRAVPWSNIEIIHWISEKTDVESDYQFDGHDNLILCDKPHTVIAACRETNP